MILLYVKKDHFPYVGPVLTFTQRPQPFFFFFFTTFPRVFTYDQISSVDYARIERSGCMKMPKNYYGEVTIAGEG